jgi:transcriptional regulator with XRE-family HTH domain
MHVCNKLSHQCSFEDDKRFVVETQEQERLADYVRRVRSAKGLSLSKVEKNSQGEIDGSYVNRIENDLVRNVTPEKLRALAKGLGVPEDEIFDVARGKAPEPMTLQRFVDELQALGVEDFNPAKGMRALTPADMEEILAVVRSTAQTMVEQKLKAKKKG